MRALVGIVSCCILIFGTACSSDRHVVRAESSSHAEAQRLIQLDDEWSAAAGKRDIDRVASFYADDAVAYPPNERVAVGRDAAKRVWAAYLSEPTYAIWWKTQHAEVSASGEIGFTAGTYEDSLKGADGKLVRTTGKYLCVWAKQRDGTWKAIHDMWNTDAK